MADKKISALTGATTPLAGTEVLPIVQSGTTVKVSVADLTAGRSVSASAATISGDLTVDTNTLKVDSTNNRVGVGTATPDIQAEIVSALTGTTAGSNPILGVRSNASGRDAHIRLGDNVNASGRLGYLSGDVYIWTNGAERLRATTAGNVNLPTGNLLFGTSGKGIVDTNGNESLMFTATASAVNELTVANAATGNAPTISATGGDTNIGISLTPKGSGTTTITSGNFGVGTTASGTFDSGKIGTSHKFLTVETPSSSTYAVGQLAGSQTAAGDRLGYLTFVNTANSSSYKYTGWIGAEVEGTTANQLGARLIFSTLADGSGAGPIERLRADSKGNVVVNTAAIATTATDGFLYVPTCAGAPTGTPTSYTGRAPIVIDSTNNKLYFYSGGQWRDAGP